MDISVVIQLTPQPRIYFSGQLLYVGTGGRYWSSSALGSNSQHLDVDDNAFVTTNFRVDGGSVRCIKD
jgi:hypothetical protein